MSTADTHPSGLEVRAYEAQDFPAMQALFESVFRETMSEAFRAWKYRPGNSGAVVVYREGELVGHYGGVGADIHMQGAPAKAIQIVDVMIKPSARAAVRTHSPFFLAGSQFLERYIGYRQPYLLGYGFPSDRHLRLAQRLGLYAPVGSMQQLEWDCASLKKGVGFVHKITRISVGNFARYQSKLDQLWQQMLTGFSQQYLVKKDAAFVWWRYLQNPQQKYTVLFVQQRFTGTPVGVVVVKDNPDHMLLMDVIGAPEKIAALTAIAAHETGLNPAKVLRNWCADSWTDRFPLAAARQERLPISTPANIWTAGPAPETIRGKWWLMPGDTDFL